ncbi:probable ascorbate-specific transmembrane electron transporter 1 [Euphorbia lathyris]|uniref:probable ascorbate-specific transmembrane electron transporter 1 n=1 Tax=Euphorbia lathyris TaxID=212925 RepID=UPI0033142CA1
MAKSGSYQMSAGAVSMITHLVAVSIITLVLVWLLHFEDGFAFKSLNKLKILNVHTFLMVVGFIVMAGEGVMAYKTVPGKRRVQKAIHLTLHTIAVVGGVLGVYTAFKFKHEIGSKDMITLHSWLGISAISLFALQWLLGVFSFVYPRAEMSRRGSYLPWHVFGGIFIFMLAISAALTGLIQRFSSLNQQGLIINFTGILLVLFAVGVSLTAVLPRR